MGNEMKRSRWSVGLAAVVAVVTLTSCGGGDTGDVQEPGAVLTSIEPTGERETTSPGPSPTVGSGTTADEPDSLPRGEESDPGNADTSGGNDTGQSGDGDGMIGGRVVEPPHQDQYPSDPMDNETMPETRSRSKPGLDCMDSELGDVRENLGRPVTCADVGDGPQWVEGEPYW
jgi:hypothetical protein